LLKGLSFNPRRHFINLWGNKLDSTIANGIIIKKVTVPQGYKYNIPFSTK